MLPPRLMLVTAPDRMRPSFEIALEAALTAGARFVQLRTLQSTPGEKAELATRAIGLCGRFDARLVINSPHNVEGLAGIHWPEALIPSSCDCPLWGASVHSVEAARRAERAGAHYVVFGSVFPTASHPGAPAAGEEALRVVARAVDIPVYAIGGITPERVAACRAAGAHGVAVIGAVWDAPDCGAIVHEFLTALAG